MLIEEKEHLQSVGKFLERSINMRQAHSKKKEIEFTRGNARIRMSITEKNYNRILDILADHGYTDMENIVRKSVVVRTRNIRKKN